MKVSLITTERNEAAAIAEFIDSALAQSVQPDEIVIADGGSTDGTVEIIEDYIKKGAPIKLIKAPGNRSIGRNAATKAARNEVVAVTDVGCRLDKDWLKNISEPFNDPKTMTVAGAFDMDPKSNFEKVSSTLMYYPNKQIDIKTWLPSSRSVAYRKTAWAKAGGYPEHTNFNEDTPFDLRLKAAGYEFADGLKAVVYWRPRPTWGEFYKQFYWYAVGDALDRINWFDYLKLVAVYLLSGIGIIAFILTWQWYWLLPFGFLCFRLLARMWRPWRELKGGKTFFMMIGLLMTFHISQLRGYCYGLLHQDRLRNSQKLVR